MKRFGKAWIQLSLTDPEAVCFQDAFIFQLYVEDLSNLLNTYFRDISTASAMTKRVAGSIPFRASSCDGLMNF